jgi:drug/metabolite transporter (DMT)-like permease
MLASVLALFAGVSWGTADFLAGERSRRLSVLTVLLVSQAVGLVAIAAVVAMVGDAFPGAPVAVQAALAGVAGTVGIGALYRGLAIGRMGVVAPISATAVMVPVVVGLASGERPTSVQAAGMVVAVMGAVLVARQPGGDGPRTSSGAGLALAAAVMLGLAILGIDEASEADPLWTTLLLRLTALGILGAAVAVVRPSLSVSRGDAGVLAVIGLLDTAAIASFAVATTRGLLSLVSVLTEMYPVVTILLARMVLRERLSRTQAAGVAVAMTGVALIAGG